MVRLWRQPAWVASRPTPRFSRAAYERRQRALELLCRRVTKRPRAQDDAGGHCENFEVQALIACTLEKNQQALVSQTHDYHYIGIYFLSCSTPFFCRRLKLRRCGRRLRSLHRPHGSLRLRRLLALLPGRSKCGCDSRQRSCLSRGRSRRRTSCTRTPRPGRSLAASTLISSLGAACPTKSSGTGRRASAS